jgi:transposase InsO family protein
VYIVNEVFHLAHYFPLKRRRQAREVHDKSIGEKGEALAIRKSNERWCRHDFKGVFQLNKSPVRRLSVIADVVA